MNRTPAITERLAELKSWRIGISTQIARVTEFLQTHDFLTPNLEAALGDALAQVARQNVTVAFIAEVSRGKSELINGLFFADLGRRLPHDARGEEARSLAQRTCP